MATLARSPQGPRGLPILGNAPALARGTLRFLRTCAEQYGDLVPLRFFWKRILLVNHPDLIEHVLAVHQHQIVKDIAQRTDHALIGDGLFLREGDAWRSRRRLMQPAFHRERIAAYGATMVARTEREIAPWRDGETRDCYADMSHLTLTIVADTMFGADLRAEAPMIARALGTALDCLSERVRGPQLFVPDALPTPLNRRMRRAAADRGGRLPPDRRAPSAGRGAARRTISSACYWRRATTTGWGSTIANCATS